MRIRNAGFTLVQLLVVLFVTTLLMGLIIAWMNQTFKFTSQVHAQKRLNQQLGRLSANLRDDVQLSRDMSVNESRLELTLDGGRQVTYELGDGWIQKEVRSGESLVAQDRFALAADSIVQWKTDQVPQRIGLLVLKNRDRAKRKLRNNDTADSGDATEVAKGSD